METVQCQDLFSLLVVAHANAALFRFFVNFLALFIATRSYVFCPRQLRNDIFLQWLFAISQMKFIHIVFKLSWIHSVDAVILILTPEAYSWTTENVLEIAIVLAQTRLLNQLAEHHHLLGLSLLSN